MRSVMAALCMAAFAPAAGAGAAPLVGGTEPPIVEPSRRPDDVVLVHREIIGEIAGADRGPTLTVYGDGRAIAHYPIYMKRAGDWERRLAPRELDALLASLVAKGVLEFDVAATRAATRAASEAARARARAARRPPALFEASDQSTTVIELSLVRYAPATAGARAAGGIAKRVAWTGLHADALAHPDVPALHDLAAAERELRALRESPGFTRMR
ncbi:MAG: hypothetical protein IT294_14845 [Deltaproteobacteria bacterium]|nr:hypothetical protein [Deltaproteobacteria bacterium]